MLLLAIALLWPAIVQQRPAYFFDSASYLSTGTKAFAIARDKIAAKLAPASATSAVVAHAPAAPRVNNVVSIRAIAYSLFAAATSAPGDRLHVLIAVNALVVTLLIWAFWRIRAPRASPRDEALAALFVATATSAPWFVSYAMPDIFAGAAILALLILTFAPLHRQRVARAAVASVVTFAVAAHASHIPIIGLVVAAAVAELLFERWRGTARWSWGRLAWVVVPFIAGLVLVLALSFASFGSASVAPKRLPFALAKSIDDGPGNWYLKATCPEEHWAVCPFFARTGGGGPELIFSDGGLVKTATPAEMEAVRNEEMTIVRNATRAYPWVQIRSAIANSVTQFFRFGLEDNSFGYVIVQLPSGEFRTRAAPERVDLRPVGQVMVYGGVAVALGYIAAIARSLTAVEWGTLRLMLAGLVANAMVTGALSSITSRYQSRVIWVVPVVALGLWLARRSPLPQATESAAAASPAQR
ncbi:MAG TPA: hypothetical protein PK808_00175 [Polymorphobacter sp.]|nr:hypothetical protein [Polymorphobacter sp.]